jgi:NADPH:quinone reductase-like Zn-dependent oxidoreductase
MKAAWYEKQGPARAVLTVGEMPDPTPKAGEVRIRVAASGINPGDIRPVWTHIPPYVCRDILFVKQNPSRGI